ncbi:hypothetical protein NDU88_004418 [Pleurodeles waltl]|uniref:Uncharacterized protein n=1 Tax=Pleurodeles waltl TaxID=8319 RepID=A0AAV7W7F9_PLEWA|nr:hypothetical protein NDU88_004418 [Pleurodeles waltl]
MAHPGTSHPDKTSSILNDLQELTLSDEETAAFAEDYDMDMQLTFDIIQQQLDTEEHEKQRASNALITGPCDVNQVPVEMCVKGGAVKRSAPALKKGPSPEKHARQAAPVLKNGTSSEKRALQSMPMLKNGPSTNNGVLQRQPSGAVVFGMLKSPAYL